MSVNQSWLLMSELIIWSLTSQSLHYLELIIWLPIYEPLSLLMNLLVFAPSERWRMPNRSVTQIFRCWKCIGMHPKVCVFTDKTTYKSHTWVTQHANWPSTQQAVNNASWELFVTTLSEGTITLDSQVGSIRPTESVDEITDRLSDIKIKPGRSSLAQPKSSSAAPLLAEWPSLQERKRSHSKYTQNQLSILHYVQTEIMHCSMSLCLPIWHLLLDQALLTVAVS